MDQWILAQSGLTFDRVVGRVIGSSFGDHSFEKTNIALSPTVIIGSFEHGSKDVLTITISVEVGQQRSAKVLSADKRVGAILEESLNCGRDIVDTKVYTYSTRRGYKKAGHPRAMFVSATVLGKIGCDELNIHCMSSTGHFYPATLTRCAL